MSGPRQLVGMVVAGQQFGLRIDTVRHILGFQRLAKVPLAAAEIAGLLNLRGRIVTAIDLARRLRIERGSALPAEQAMHIVVDHRGQLYSLLVDRVGELLTLVEARFEADSGSLPAAWRPLAHGLFRLDEALLVELDIERVLDLQPVG